MAQRFIAHPPGQQPPDVYRQFVELQRYLEQLEERLAPSVALESIQPMTLTNAWQPLDLGGGVFALKGTGIYAVVTSFLVRGSSGNAEFQLRYTTSQETLTGEVISLGVEFINRTTKVFVSSKGGLTIEARGISAQIQSGAVTAQRVGIAE